MEADSLNASVLGADAVPGTPEFDIFIKATQAEMTVKAGQKCTAIRRILVPENLMEDVQIALGQRLAKTTIGDPQVEGVRMGSLATKVQVDRVMENVERLAKSQEMVFGDLENFNVEEPIKMQELSLAPYCSVMTIHSRTPTFTTSKPWTGIYI